jgi:hypothetical protein
LVWKKFLESQKSKMNEEKTRKPLNPTERSGETKLPTKAKKGRKNINLSKKPKVLPFIEHAPFL